MSRLTDKIGILVLPAIAEARGEGIVRGYRAAHRDITTLLIKAHNEGASEDEIDTLQYVENFLCQQMQEYGFDD